MDKLIPINITKGHVSSIRLTFDDKGKKLEASVCIELRTEMGEKVTEVTLSSDAWNDKQKIEIPVDVIPHAGAIRRYLEHKAVLKINGRHLALPAPKPEDLF